jgi:hypothetical protein
MSTIRSSFFFFVEQFFVAQAHHFSTLPSMPALCFEAGILASAKVLALRSRYVQLFLHCERSFDSLSEVLGRMAIVRLD